MNDRQCKSKPNVHHRWIIRITYQDTPNTVHLRTWKPERERKKQNRNTIQTQRAVQQIKIKKGHWI